MTDHNQPQFMPQRTMDGIHADMRSRASNERLERLLDQAKADAEEQRKASEESRRQAHQAIWAAWVGVGVAIVVGVATILITIIG